MHARSGPRGSALLLLGALSCAGRQQAAQPDPGLQDRVQRLESRVAQLEEAQRREAALWGGPGGPAPAPAGTEPRPPAPPGPAGEAAPADRAPSAAPPPPPAQGAPAQGAPAAPPERALLLGSAALSGPYAAVAGRGVALLQPLSGKAPPPRPRHARMEQRDRAFVPTVLALPVGSTVAFPNSDPVYHNVFSLSPTKKFDLGVFKKGESRDVVFDHPGVIYVLCNLHASMSGYLVVHEEPYAALVDRSGRFGFRDLPPGRYRLRVWHERAGEVVSKQVTLQGGQNRLQVALTADVAPTVPPNKEGRPRGARTAP